MDGAALSVSSIKQALVSTAVNFQPAYFRRLKNAIAFDLENKGHIKAATKIKAVVNPVTMPGSTLVKKAKPKRAKSFADDDLVALAKHLGEAEFLPAFAAVCLISKTGVRPQSFVICTLMEINSSFAVQKRLMGRGVLTGC